MSKSFRQLDIDRGARNRAWSRFDARLSQVREDMQPGALFSRAATHLGHQAREVGEEAMEIASEHRNVVAAAAGIATILLIKNPILAVLGFGPGEEETTEDAEDDEE